MTAAEFPWERPLGARVLDEGASEFRVWAPRARRVELELGGERLEMHEAGVGVREAVVGGAGPGADYRFVLDGTPLPDPCSRWQPQGLRGPSRVYAPAAQRAALARASAPAARPGRVRLPPLGELVIYELHVGTFSPAGTFAGAIPYLDELAELGVGAIELMPVAEFPGTRGWGYDGVYLSAAQSSYGGPAGLEQLVAAAHERGLGVILDVVYNHVGASGVPALEAFGPYFTSKYETPWGKAINYDSADCDPVREWVAQSAEGWIADFGLDGLRLDAIHAIFDQSAEHIVEQVARRVHAIAPDALVIAESGLNDPRVMRPRERGGYACDGAWADDFHHALRTLVTDERDGYYAEFGRVELLAKAYHRPHVHDGCYSSFRRRRFGARADDVPVERFVVFAQNHDQVGNRAFGDRLPAQAQPLAAFCTLLAPFVPLLFMGEEYGETAPFQFFSDHIDPEIAEATRAGRRREFAAFASFGEAIPDPQAPETFECSKLTRRRDPALADLYRALLALRRRIPPGAEAEGIAFDEAARWLRLRRGSFELIANFAAARATLPAAGELVLATHPEATALAGGRLMLPELAGAALELPPPSSAAAPAGARRAPAAKPAGARRAPAPNPAGARAPAANPAPENPSLAPSPAPPDPPT
jgi:maltooligosyltrehalose trehalohydrolase